VAKGDQGYDQTDSVESPKRRVKGGKQNKRKGMPYGNHRGQKSQKTIRYCHSRHTVVFKESQQGKRVKEGQILNTCRVASRLIRRKTNPPYLGVKVSRFKPNERKAEAKPKKKLKKVEMLVTTKKILGEKYDQVKTSGGVGRPRPMLCDRQNDAGATGAERRGGGLEKPPKAGINSLLSRD